MIDEVKALRVEVASLKAERDQLRRSVGDLCRKYDKDLAAANARTDAAEAALEAENLGAKEEQRALAEALAAAPAPDLITDGCFHGEKAHPCALLRVQELEIALRLIRTVAEVCDDAVHLQPEWVEKVINEVLKEEV